MANTLALDGQGKTSIFVAFLGNQMANTQTFGEWGRGGVDPPLDSRCFTLTRRQFGCRKVTPAVVATQCVHAVFMEPVWVFDLRGAAGVERFERRYQSDGIHAGFTSET